VRLARLARLACLIPAAALAASLLASCNGKSLHHAPASAVGVPPPRTAGWKPCRGHPGWQCTTLSVPLDRRHPEGRQIALALNRHPADDPARRIGSLLVNPGGPGASGVSFAYEALGLLSPRLTSRFDIVGFDPRGVDRSAPVRCLDGPGLDRLIDVDPFPTTSARRQAIINSARQLSVACRVHAGPELPFLSTLDAARDMDDIRAALGDRRLSYLGFSYGTYLGAVYANLFPTHVRALALDGAIDPALDSDSIAFSQAEAFERDLDAFLAWCGSAGPQCPFGLHSARSRRITFNDLMARIENHPLPGKGARSLGPGEAIYGIALPLYEQSTWPGLAGALEAAENGDGRLLLTFSDLYNERHDDGSYDNIQEANAAINCLDHPVSHDLRTYDALATRTARVAPFFGPAVAWMGVTCAFWPAPPVLRPQPIRAAGSPPILVIGSTGDPATPYAWSRSLAHELAKGFLLTRQGEGHGGYPASACVRDAADHYLTTLALPASGTVCH